MYCVYCGKQIDDDTIFCPYCGKNQSATTKAEADTDSFEEYEDENDLPVSKGINSRGNTPIKASPKMIAAFIGAVLLALIGGGLFAYQQNKKASADGHSTEDALLAESDNKGAKRVDATAANTGAESVNKDGLDTYDDIRNLVSGPDVDEAYASLISSDVSEYPIVRLYLRIEDAGGEALSFDDPRIAIREKIAAGEMIEREIKSLQQLEGNEGLSIDLIADKSGSMYDSIYQMQSVMEGFIHSLDYRSGDRVELISFDSFIMYMCTYSDNPTLLTNGINNMVPYGDTAMYDALMEGVRNASNQPGARCVIAFTDGQDNISSHSADDVIHIASTNDVPIYIIGIGNVDVYTLTRIANNTNGHYWDIDDLNAMTDILNKIYTVQKDMYCVEYISDDSKNAFSPRHVEVVITDDKNGCEISEEFKPVQYTEKKTHSSRYEIVQSDVSWTEANAAALQAGGHLVTISTAAEMQTLVNMAEQAGLKYIWIGGYTSVRNHDVFGHWVTGESFDFSAWYPGEPSRNDLDGAPEMYLMLWNVKDTWSWNDQRNDPIGETGLEYFRGATGYIIEYED